MAIMDQLRSPLPWIGGKHYSARFIIEQFPAAEDFDVFVDVFGGGANVLLNKPVGKHLEVYNDTNDDLVNCWMHLRDHHKEMVERLSTLPFARSLYYQYHTSLFDGTELPLLERAVRWYYVLVCSFRAQVEITPSGWLNGARNAGNLHSHTYRRLPDLLAPIAERFRFVEIDNRDFEKVVRQYESQLDLKTLLYCDPPYIDSEHYYKTSKDADSTMFHQRLARVLNATPAMVALSYYDHPLLDELYPADKWQRDFFETTKHSQRTKATRDKAREVLLRNYVIRKPQTLWDSSEEVPA